MNIVYLHQYFVTPNQAGATRSYEMARRLVDAGHRVEMITSDQAPEPDQTSWRVTYEAGIKVHWIGQPYNNSMGFLARIKAFIGFAVAASRRAATIRDADVIFATSTPLTIAIPAIYTSWRTGKPYVFEVRDIWPAVPIAMGVLNSGILKWLARRLEHMAYHRADHVVTLAPGMAEEVEKTGYPRESISVIPNGCDNSIFAKSSRESTLAEYELWLKDRPMLLYAGSIGKVNGVGYLVDVAKAMLALDPDIRLVIIGKGADRNSVIERAVMAGVLDRNLKVIPAVSKVNLVEWIHRSTLCLAMIDAPQVLWKDAVQNKFFDALAAGKPVISNKPGWQNRIAEEYGVGAIMADNDPKAAAETLRNYARDEEWLRQASIRAHKLASGRFNRDKLAIDLERCLANVVSNNNISPKPAV